MAARNDIVVRFADDIVVGFQDKSGAQQFRGELTERMLKFDLELHPEKTRLLEFGPFAVIAPAGSAVMQHARSSPGPEVKIVYTKANVGIRTYSLDLNNDGVADV
jgi:hypothetical protein